MILELNLSTLPPLNRPLYKICLRLLKARRPILRAQDIKDPTNLLVRPRERIIFKSRDVPIAPLLQNRQPLPKIPQLLGIHEV